MKNKLFILVLLTSILLFATSCTSGTGVQINTPAPDTSPSTGQIDVPGFKIQFNAPGVNPLVNTVDANGRASSFVIGVWHGIISPGTLVVSVFNSNVQMYEVHNDGSQYNFGFLIGVAIIFLILGILLSRRRRRVL